MSQASDCPGPKGSSNNSQLFVQAVEASTDAIGLSTAEGEHWYQNAAFSDLFGNISDDPPASVYVDEKQGREVFAAIMGGKEWLGEVQMYGRDGQILDILLRAYPVKDNGKVVGLVGVHTDVTEQRRVADRLLASEGRLWATLNSIGDAVIATDTSGHVVWLNAIAERLTGWSAEVATGKLLMDFLQNCDADQIKLRWDPVAEVLEYGKIVGVPNHSMLVIRTGERRRVAASGAPIRNAGGEVIGVVLVFRDTTEEHALQVQLEQSRRLDAVGQMAGGIAHDFNNMLCGVLGAAELLRRRVDHESLSYVDMIVNAAESAADLTNQLLAFSRSGDSAEAPVDVHAPIHETVELLTRTLDRRINIRLELNASQSAVIGHSSQLQNVFLNLGINAGHAMPDGGDLIYSTRVVELDEANAFMLNTGEYLEVSVTDAGCGMTPEVMSRIFEPFFTTRDVGLGTGLGLSAAYGIVQQHRGTITVESEPGQGTTFRILLPLSMDDPGQERVTEEESVSGAGTILLVEDEPVIRVATEKLLAELGYKVFVAEDGAQGLRFFSDHREEIDLVMLDMTMPKMDGRTAFYEIRKIAPQAPIILVSGYAGSTNVGELIEQGPSVFVAKPYKGAELSRTIAQMLERRRRT